MRHNTTQSEDEEPEAYLEQSHDSDHDNEYNEKEFSVNNIKK